MDCIKWKDSPTINASELTNYVSFAWFRPDKPDFYSKVEYVNVDKGIICENEGHVYRQQSAGGGI